MQETSKKVGEVSFELLENPFDEKNNFIKVISSNQPSETWKNAIPVHSTALSSILLNI